MFLSLGKTLTARAIAKTTGCTFINVRQSTLQNKYFGETQKIVKAVFSVAHKFAPSIIFVDECDSLFRARTGGDDVHEVTNSLRTEWMSLWDGLISSAKQSEAAGHVIAPVPTSSSSSAPAPPLPAQLPRSVTVLACTNRPQDLDAAFMRRLPLVFLFPLPTPSERLEVLTLLLKKQRLDPKLTLSKIVDITEGYSSSDLSQLCQAAAMIPLRSILKKGLNTEFNNVMMGEEVEEKQVIPAVAEEEEPSADQSSQGSQADKATSVIRSASAAISSLFASASAIPGSTSSTSTASSSSSSSSDLSSSLSTPRALRFSDFRKAATQIRPSATMGSCMKGIADFDRKHNHHLHSQGLAMEEEDQSEEEEEREDQGDKLDEDIYK